VHDRLEGKNLEDWLTVMTNKALSAPDKTIDFGCRIAIKAAIMNVSSPIYQKHHQLSEPTQKETKQETGF